MDPSSRPLSELRRYRNSKLYRPLGRTLRVYNRRLLSELHARGFEDFAPSFPQMLSNLDTAGTRIGVLAARAGVTRQAAGQLLAEIERCGYVERRPAHDDARATVVHFTPRGRHLLATVFTIVEKIEAEFAEIIGRDEFDRVRVGLARIADAIDPEGAFGEVDEPATPARRRRAHASSR
jgi:DNA-binding MarR family transcriptional regulator